MPQRLETLTQAISDIPEAFWYSVPVFLAFSKWIRKQIGKRDNWECQAPECDDGTGEPKAFYNGWMVDASHYPEHHSKDDPLYDTQEGGDIRCLDHHKEQHERGTTLGREKDEWAVKAIDGRDRRTFDYRKKQKKKK